MALALATATTFPAQPAYGLVRQRTFRLEYTLQRAENKLKLGLQHRSRAVGLDDQELESTFYKNYREALLALKIAVSNVACTAGVERLTTFADSELSRADRTLVSRAQFFVKGPSKLAMYEYDVEQSPGKPAARVACVTSDYAFTLKRRNPGEPFVVDYFGADRNKVAFSLAEYSEGFVLAAFRPPRMPIEEILEDPKFKLAAISAIVNNAETLVEIHFELPGSSLPYESGRIVLSPAIGWAVLEYESVWRSVLPGWRTVSIGNVSYMHPEADRLFPQTVRLVEQTWKDGKEWSKHDWKAEFTDVTFDSVTDEQFTLPAFGLPDIPLETEPRSHFPFDQWLFWTLASIAILCTFVLHWRRGTNVRLRRESSAALLELKEQKNENRP